MSSKASERPTCQRGCCISAGRAVAGGCEVKGGGAVGLPLQQRVRSVASRDMSNDGLR